MDSRAMNGVLAAFVLLSAALTGTFAADTFTVGGDRNWIVPNAGLNYTVWAQNITARVGDSLYFKYNPNGHNVLKVNFTVYSTCNTSNYMQVWDTGDTTVLLQQAETEYFMCGAPNHCLMGQAFAINVLPAPSDVTPPGGILSPPKKNTAVSSLTNVAHFWPVVFVSTMVLLCSSRLS